MRYKSPMPAYRCSICEEIHDLPREAVACCVALKDADNEGYQTVWRCPNCWGIYEDKADAETCC